MRLDAWGKRRWLLAASAAVFVAGWLTYFLGPFQEALPLELPHEGEAFVRVTRAQEVYRRAYDSALDEVNTDNIYERLHRLEGQIDQERLAYR